MHLKNVRASICPRVRTDGSEASLYSVVRALFSKYGVLCLIVRFSRNDGR